MPSLKLVKHKTKNSILHSSASRTKKIKTHKMNTTNNITEKHGTYADNNHIYSNDLMFMYIQDKRPKSVKLPLASLIHHLRENDWSDWSTPGTPSFSAMDVLKNPNKYKEHYRRILDAKLKYPIIIDKKTGYVIDGMHRLAKSYMLNKPDIRAHVFDDKLMSKFILTSKPDTKKEWTGADWEYYESLTIPKLKQLYREQFP